MKKTKQQRIPNNKKKKTSSAVFTEGAGDPDSLATSKAQSDSRFTFLNFSCSTAEKGSTGGMAGHAYSKIGQELDYKNDLKAQKSTRQKNMVTGKASIKQFRKNMTRE